MGRATQSKQSRAKKPQSQAKVPQSRAKKEPQSRAEAPQPRPSLPKARSWNTCVNFLSKGYNDMCNTARNSVQLVNVVDCSALLHGVQAEVNWYIGGNAFVEMPTAVAVVMPGLYLAKTTWYRMGPNFPEEDAGPDTAVASINNLRWLGTTSEFLEVTKASRNVLGKTKYDRLLEMLTFNCDNPPDGME